MTLYLLTHEYSDKSAFTVCGLTESRLIAELWIKANNSENKAFELETENILRADAMSGFQAMEIE